MAALCEWYASFSDLCFKRLKSRAKGTFFVNSLALLPLSALDCFVTFSKLWFTSSTIVIYFVISKAGSDWKSTLWEIIPSSSCIESSLTLSFSSIDRCPDCDFKLAEQSIRGSISLVGECNNFYFAILTVLLTDCSRHWSSLPGELALLRMRRRLGRDVSRAVSAAVGLEYL